MLTYLLYAVLTMAAMILALLGCLLVDCLFWFITTTINTLAGRSTVETNYSLEEAYERHKHKSHSDLC